ncbi:type III polyketide synthase [Sphingomonas profundi]|uniref:type III polyketide synthase n=1 Tax=Alterirhizorhabdus profundi TaxID=2681549 RepID=UPI0012E91810|nr:type III polyketide synthase [Sphingomonas profundi]
MDRPTATINAIGTAVPDHDVHAAFIGWAERRLADPRKRALFRRMAERSGIAHRWSVLPTAAHGGSPVEVSGFYADAILPSTAARMHVYAQAAPALALAAIGRLGPLGRITHLVVASCTGFVAPGIDQILAAALGLDGGVERTLVGFMGCYAAVAALRAAHHIVRSEPAARVLVVTVELSTLHLQPDDTLEPLLAMLQFGDGAAAAIVSADPHGLAIDGMFAATLPDSADLIRWRIGDQGFAMHLSGEVPGRIAAALRDPAFTAGLFGPPQAVDAWAVHAGGRSILDAVEGTLALDGQALAPSRRVLADYGNMSSATLMFVLAGLIGRPVANGVAVAFGPGLAAEGFRFRSVP